MAHRKRRVFQHIMADNSIKLIKEYFPDEWVIREYSPDYGIDIVVEIFDYIDDKREVCEALGEMFFAQVKSIKSTEISTVDVYPRRNVELSPLIEDKSEVKQIEVIKFKLDTDEILTINSMGAGVTVFLILVCLDTRRVFYVCLNDLIEKIIIPTDEKYVDKKTKTIYIPVKNELTPHPGSHILFRFFAKRMKFYAAFTKFVYQRNELKHSFESILDKERDIDDYLDILQYLNKTLHFLSIIKKYDIWFAGEIWGILNNIFKSLEKLEKKIIAIVYLINEKIEVGDTKIIPEINPDFQWTPPLIIIEIKTFWDRLVNLSEMYEEICREWNLPTFLGDELS
ncbi:hypothetical protein BW899_09275 [Bacillus mycoides]|uniref:DUF4365 domain-containing protein n=2 Tax=Bacillaceae TaxID=186817 RepID=UPI00099427F3|nr:MULTISPECIES: DUF4365 domain-containing protein [Bacillus cereus group]OOR00875.1 hypothetical protein BW899_09275 [Bacillus mycoides]OUB66199.1 hypothetical protein BK744_27235 [Bacillus thuringiensis serovar zhaodongensis]UKS62293.1 DUF4365 domain-containing protein [Bacillus toyonensis]HDR7590572.1 DUF4365 domain-containing protein [Bacillus mycoides]HDR7590620.1 DUF4365 domain-containing protein [Bacillus mycoides]